MAGDGMYVARVSSLGYGVCRTDEYGLVEYWNSLTLSWQQHPHVVGDRDEALSDLEQLRTTTAQAEVVVDAKPEMAAPSVKTAADLWSDLAGDKVKDILKGWAAAYYEMTSRPPNEVELVISKRPDGSISIRFMPL